jgi:succinate dehydrogenase hydrophobic anchor subunit
MQGQAIGRLEQPEIEAAKVRIRWSWIVTAIFTIIIFPVYLGMMITAPDLNVPVVVKLLRSTLASLLFGYIVWSAYWGIPTIWKWLLEVAKGIRGQVSIDHLTMFALYIFFFWFPIIIGIPYGILGGGAYQYLKQRKLAALSVASAAAV